MSQRLTQSEWESNVIASLTYLTNITGNLNPQWIIALRSALRVARDFDRDVKVMWNGTNYRIYSSTEHIVGNFDICLTTGRVIH